MTEVTPACTFRIAAGGRNQTQDILQEATERTEKMPEGEVSPLRALCFLL